jgi:hypothetical protein
VKRGDMKNKKYLNPFRVVIFFIFHIPAFHTGLFTLFPFGEFDLGLLGVVA